MVDESKLQEVYGHGAGDQQSRYHEALRTFKVRYGPGEIFIFRAPGRVNLIGEHTDYNHGYVMPAALDKDILLLARPRSDSQIRVANVETGFAQFNFTIGPDIAPGPSGAWENYAKGGAQLLARKLGRNLIGLDGLAAGQPPDGVPRGAGLSSSTALSVVVAIALARFNHWQPDDTTFAQFCAEAEWYVGTRGGVLDQFSMLLTRQNQALFLDCRPDSAGNYTMDHVPLPAGYRLMVANSGVHHRNVGGGYNQRVAACRAGVELLRPRFPDMTHLRDVQPVPWTELAGNLPEVMTIDELRRQGVDLGDLPGITADTRLKIRARCRHVWTENERVKAAATALQHGDVSAMGRLLNEAHASARDDYEISCAEIESLVKAAREVDGVIGARLTGAGWGGCIVALVSDEAVPAFETHVGQRYRTETNLETTIFTCRAGPGAALVSIV
jgi:galactokinase